MENNKFIRSRSNVPKNNEDIHHLHKNGGLICLSQIESGDSLFLTLEELINYVKALDPENFRKKDIPIYERDLDRELQIKLNSITEYDDTELRNAITVLRTLKADKIELQNYRPLTVPIDITDLSERVQDILYAVENGGYDDREIREEINQLKAIKMDKTDAILFRKASDLILLSDLDDSINSLLQQIPENESQIIELNEIKANKTDLDNYRHKGVAITKADLDSQLQTIIDNFDPYDDSTLKANIVELYEKKADRIELNDKADRVDLDNYRLLETPITFDDLSEHLQGILDEIPESFNPEKVELKIKELEENKVNRSELENYRSKTELLDFLDFNKDVNDAIHAISNGYDDTQVWESINTLITTKVDKRDLEEGYLKKENNVIETSYLSTELQLKLISILSKAEAAEIYRRKDITISKDDLSEELVEEIERKIDLTQIQEDITVLKSDMDEVKPLKETKADKTYVDENFRNKTEEITEDDLSQELQNKINESITNTNLTEITNKVNNLENQLPHKLDITQFESEKDNLLSKADAETLYRKNNVPINEDQLSAAVLTKLNLATNDHTNLIKKNDDDAFLHITRTEYEMFLGYRDKFETVMNRLIELELTSGLQSEPIITSSSIDGLLTVPLEVGEIVYTVLGGNLSLVNPSLITMTPNKINGEIELIDNKLHIPIDVLDENTNYIINIPKSVIKNGDILNRQSYETQFLSETLKYAPVINHSTINGSVNVPLTLNEILLPVTSDEEIEIVDESLITITPNILSSVVCEDNNLKLSVNGLVETTNYTITVAEGAIRCKESLLTNISTFTEVFTTLDVKTKPIINNCAQHLQTEVEITDTEFIFNVTVGEEINLVDSSLISIHPTTEITNVEIIDDTLVVNTVELMEDTDYTISIPSGVLQDGDDLFNDELINTFHTKDYLTKPILSDIESLSNKNDIDFLKDKLLIGVECSETINLVDTEKITLTPDVINGDIVLNNNTIEIPVALNELTDYTLTIFENAIQDGDDLFNDEFIINFSTREKITEPIIQNSSLHNRTDVELNLTYIDIPVLVEEELVIADDTKITVNPDIRNGLCEVVDNNLTIPVHNLVEDTTYTITISPGALQDGDDLTNSSLFVNTFKTIDIKTKPVINNSSLNEQTDVPVSTEVIEFSIECDEEPIIVDESKIVITPDVKNGDSIIEDRILKVNISGLVECTEYTISILEGAVQNGDDLLNDEVVNTFITEDVKTKAIIHQNDINGRTDVDHTTLNTLEYVIECDEEMIVGNLDLITSNEEILTTKEVLDNKLVLTLENLLPSTEYTITIPSGVIQNGDDLFNDELITTFTTKSEASEDDNVEWVFEKVLSGVGNNYIMFSEIEEAVGVTGMDDTFFYSATEENFNNDIIDENPKYIVEYRGSTGYPLDEAVRIPRAEIDDGSVCPLIPIPSHIPSGVQCYTMDAVMFDIDRLYFEGNPIVPHIIRVKSMKI